MYLMQLTSPIRHNTWTQEKLERVFDRYNTKYWGGKLGSW